MTSPAGGVIAKLRLSATVAAALPSAHASTSEKGVFGVGAVIPGAAHPLLEVGQVGGPIEYHQQGIVFEDYNVIVAAIDEAKSPVAPRAGAYAASEAVYQELLTGGPEPNLPIDGYRTWRVWEEVGATELSSFENGVSEFRVTRRIRIRVSRV